MENPKAPVPNNQRDGESNPSSPGWIQTSEDLSAAPFLEVFDYFKDYDWRLVNEYRHVIELDCGICVERVAQHFPKMLMFYPRSHGPSPKLSDVELARAATQLIQWSDKIYDIEVSRVSFDYDRSRVLRGPDGTVLVFEPKELSQTHKL